MKKNKIKSHKEDIKLKRIGYDEIFKTLMSNYFSKFAKVVTDYELLDLPKKADLLIIKTNKSIKKYVKVLTYFKQVNILEFKSEADPFRINRDLFKAGIYICGVLLKEESAELDNTTFTIISSRKPAKLLKLYKENIKLLTRGVYLMCGVHVLPVHIVVIDELEYSLEKELTILKEFSLGKDREKFLVEIINAYCQNKHEFYDNIKYAAMLYKEELAAIILKQGEQMNRVLKNMEEWNVELGLKQKYIEQGIEQGFEQGIKKDKISTCEKLLAAGCDLKFIVKITELSLSEVKKIKNSLNK